MSAEIFLDTNILVYAYSLNEPEKREVCEELLARKHICASIAVLNEFTNVLRRKFERSGGEIVGAINELTEHLTILDVGLRDIREAIHIWERHKLHHYDALHLACARRHGCNLFMSEDMHPGTRIGNLRVLNPFTK